MTEHRSSLLPFSKGLVLLLLSGLLLVQTSIAGFGSGSAASEEGASRIVICGAGGVTTITIAADGTRTVEDGGEREAAQCPFCLISPAVVPECEAAALTIDLRPIRQRTPSSTPLARAANVDPACAIRAPPQTV